MILATHLQTPRLALRRLAVEDADEMFAVLNDERLHTYIGGQPLSAAALLARYRRLARGVSPDGSQLWWNWTVRLHTNGAAIGSVQATVTNHDQLQRAQIAWTMGVAWQAQGFASEAALALVQWLNASAIEVRANIHPRHIASQKVAQRAGLSACNEWVDGEQVWRLQTPTANAL